MFLKFLRLNAHFARYQQSSLCEKQLFCEEGYKYVCAQQCCVIFGTMPPCARMELQQRAVRFPSKQGKSMCYLSFCSQATVFCCLQVCVCGEVEVNTHQNSRPPCSQAQNGCHVCRGLTMCEGETGPLFSGLLQQLAKLRASWRSACCLLQLCKLWRIAAGESRCRCRALALKWGSRWIAFEYSHSVVWTFIHMQPQNLGVWLCRAT